MHKLFERLSMKSSKVFILDFISLSEKAKRGFDSGCFPTPVMAFTDIIRRVMKSSLSLKTSSADEVVVMLPSNLESHDHQFGEEISLMSYFGVRLVLSQKKSFIVENDFYTDLLKLTKIMSQKNDVYLFSSNPLALVVAEQANIVNVDSMEVLNSEKFAQENGLTISKVKDFFALTGLKSLQIPSLIGPNTAISLLNKHGTGLSLFSSISSETTPIRNLLKDSFQDYSLSREIVDPEVTRKDELVFNEFFEGSATKNLEKVRNFYERNRMSIWNNQFSDGHMTNPNYGSKTTFTLPVVDDFDLNDFENAYKSSTVVAVAMVKNKFYFSFREGESFELDISLGQKSDVIKSTVLSVLENEKIVKVSHDSKQLYAFARLNGVKLRSMKMDTAIASFMLDNTMKESSIYDVAERFLVKPTGYESSGKVLSLVRGEISDTIFRVAKKINIELSKNPILKKSYFSIENPLIETLANMEFVGVGASKTKFKEALIALNEKLNAITSHVYKIAMIDPNALGGINFLDTLSGLKKSTKDQDLIGQLNDFEEKHNSIISMISNINGYLNHVGDDGRIRSTFIQNRQKTGRLSCIDPNLHGIPAKSEEADIIRKAFGSEAGKYIVSMDYSQVELKILAHLSEDEMLISIIKSGVDLHTATAATVFDVPLEDVTSDMRRAAKAINFGLVYGISAYGLSNKINSTIDVAQEYINKYFGKFSGVKAYLEKTVKFAEKNGYVETLFGKRIQIENIQSSDKTLKSKAIRAAKNAPMQGSAAELIKFVMIKCSQYLENLNGDEMLLQVHDDLIFELGTHNLAAKVNDLKNIMENSVNLRVPLTVEPTIGKDLNTEFGISKINDLINSKEGLEVRV